MPSSDFETSDIAANMAETLVSHDRYAGVLKGIDTRRIAFLHAPGKKQPKGNPSPVQIKGLSPLMKVLAGGIVFVVVIYDDWFDWSEAKQYAGILEQLLLIKNDDEKTFDEGKLIKYDVVALQYMVENFGLHWTSSTDVRHPFDAPSRRTTFSGDLGRVVSTEENAVTQVLSDNEASDLGDELDGIPDELEA